VLLLITTGRKSGQPRPSTLYTFPHRVSRTGENYVVIASNAGHPSHPAWCLNLRADPNAIVHVAGRRFGVLAREAEGEERERLWAQIIAWDPDYAEYQGRTDRLIPVIILEPREGGGEALRG
jgi:deazaflavin-dependent oxidoreductase (nitroreductase family)